MANLYVINKSNGNQILSETIDADEKPLGLWKFKRYKLSFVFDHLCKMDLKNKNGEPLGYWTIYSLSDAIVSVLSKNKKIEFLKLNLLYYLNELYNRNKDNYVSKYSVIKHFKNTNSPIDKEFIVQMERDKLVRSRGNQIIISPKGLEFLESKKVNN